MYVGSYSGSCLNSARRSLTTLTCVEISDKFSPTVFERPSQEKFLRKVCNAATTSFVMQSILSNMNFR